MANRRYLGHAAGVKHIATLVIGGTWVATETITLTIDGIDVVITVGAATPTTAQVATLVKQAFNGETLTDSLATVTPNTGVQEIAQFREIVATVSSSTVTLTATNADKPFTISRSLSSASGTATLSASATTATGKRHFSNQDNWSGNTVPVDQDTITFDFGTIGPQFGLLAAIQPAEVVVNMAFTGLIGLAEQNIDNPTYPYAEYRTPSLTFDQNATDTSIYRLGVGEGQGSSRIRLDAGAGHFLAYVYASGAREVAGVPVVLLAGSNSANEINNFDGDVGVAFYANQVCTLSKLRNGSGEASNARTICGPGVTLTSCTIEMQNGTLTTNSEIDTVNMTGGEVFHNNGDISELNVWGGEWRQRAGGTITDLALSGTFDKSTNLEALTITNAVELYKGAVFNDPHGTVTASAGFHLNGCTIQEVTINLGYGRTIDLV